MEREIWVPRRPGAEPHFRARYPDYRLRWQRGADLGERLHAAFAAAFGEGAGRALALGSDHPTLPAAHLRAAVGADPAGATAADLRLGPTEDGGYWGMGLIREAWPTASELFRGLPWSTPRLLAATRRRARELGLTVRELPSWYDVDEPGSLQRLRSDLRPGSATAAALARLDGGEPQEPPP